MAQRAQVLAVYKALHRTRQRVFVDDTSALNYVRQKIKEEFMKFRNLEDATEISKLIKIAKESEEILANKVVQAKEVRPNVYQLRSEHLQAKCTNARETCANCTCS